METQQKTQTETSIIGLIFLAAAVTAFAGFVSYFAFSLIGEIEVGILAKFLLTGIAWGTAIFSGVGVLLTLLLIVGGFIHEEEKTTDDVESS